MTIELSPCAFCNNQSVAIDKKTPCVIRYCMGKEFEVLPPGTNCNFRVERPLVDGKRMVAVHGILVR